MSTRSAIGYKDTDGTVKAIYCHFDGYPNGVGKTLRKYYNSIDKAKELVSMGSISTLSNSIKNTTFYHRDMGENYEVLTYKSTDDFMYMDNTFIEYRYLYINEYHLQAGAWFVMAQENAQARKPYSVLNCLINSHEQAIRDIVNNLKAAYDNYLLFTANKVSETENNATFKINLLSDTSNDTLTAMMAQIIQNDDAIESIIEALLQEEKMLEFQLTVAAYLENIEKEENKSTDIPID